MPKRELEGPISTKESKKLKQDDSSSSSSSSSDSDSSSGDSDSTDSVNNSVAKKEAIRERRFGIGADTEGGAGQQKAENDLEEIEKTDFKVFVSRIPPLWDAAKIKEYFSSLFGEVVSVDLFGPGKEEKAEIWKETKKHTCYAYLKGQCAKGDGCEFSHEVIAGGTGAGAGAGAGKGIGQKGVIYYRTQESVDMALRKGTIHVSSRNMRISAYHSTADGRDTSTCYAWAKFNCSRGDECIFAHDGPGACVKASAPGQGRKYCLSFRSKGKCSKGSDCLFQHVMKQENSVSGPLNKRTVFESADAGEGAPGEEGKEEKRSTRPSTAGICDKFRKTGKCRKGDRCKYEHPVAYAAKTTELAVATNPVPEKSTKKLRFNKVKEKYKEQEKAKLGNSSS